MSAVANEGETPLSMEEAYACIAGLDTDMLAMGELGPSATSAATSTAARTATAVVSGADAARESRARELLSSVSVSLPSVQKESQHQKRARAGESAKAVPAAPKPKKKRVRREKRELDYLRGMVGKLEQQMTELKAQASDTNSQLVRSSAHSSGSLAEVGRCARQAQSTTCSSMWQGIAERQLQARKLSEEQNRKLRSSLEGQLQLASKLENLLSKQPKDEEAVALESAKPEGVTATHVKREPRTDDDIFAEQLAHVKRAHLDVAHLFEDSGGWRQGQPQSNIFVKNDGSKDTGVVFEVQNRDVLPFNLEVTATAIWRALAIEGIKKHGQSHELRTDTNNLIAQSFAVCDKVGAFSAKMHCKHTIRRCVERDRVVIMAKSVMVPSELNGIKFYGVESHQTVWMVLDKLDPSGASAGGSAEDSGDLVSRLMTSTSIRVYSQTTMELKPDIVHQELEVGTLTEFVLTMHDTAVTVCRNMVEDFLVQEDMNANCWLDGLAL